MTDNKTSRNSTHALWYILKICLITLFVVCALLFITIWAFNTHLESNEKKIIDNITFLNQGTVSFGEARLSLINDFPFATVVLNSVDIRDSSQLNTGHPIIHAEKISARLSLTNWRTRSLDIKHITITKGNIQLFKDAAGLSNVQRLLSKNKNVDKSTINDKDISINTSELKLSLIDTKINYVDSLKTTSIDVFANSILASLDESNGLMTASVDMDVNVHKLVFKKTNGSYLSNSHLKGQFDINIKDQHIDIPECDVKINQDPYRMSAQISTNKELANTLTIKNKRVNFLSTIKLLTPKLQQTLLPYKVKGKFPATATIILNPGDPAKVTVDFNLDGNDVDINNLAFSNLRTRGRFINRQNDNELTSTLSTGSILLTLQDVHTHLNSILIQSDHVEIKSTGKDQAKIAFEAQVTGPSSEISEWYESERFFFDGGDFILNTTINSPINDVKDILLKSSADLTLREVAILYKPSNTAMPVHELNLVKDVGDAQFFIKSSTLVQQHTYRLDGVLQNLTALLVDYANESATSDVTFNASVLSWSDFISIFSLTKHDDTEQLVSDKKSKRNMKETLQGIHRKFKPSLTINIDTFEYFDLIKLFNLKTGAAFSDDNTLRLLQTEFNLNQGSVTLHTSLDLQEPHETDFSIELKGENINIEELLPVFNYFNIELLKSQDTYPDDLNLDIQLNGRVDDVTGLIANTASGVFKFSSQHLDDLNGSIIFAPNQQNDGIRSSLTLEGNPLLFNDFFKNDKFIFQDTGRFTTTFNYEGDVVSFNQLLKESVVDLTIKDGAVHNLDVDVIFPLNDLELTLDQDTAVFDLYMYSDYIDRELKLSGEIENLSELLFANTGKKLRTKVTASSPLINLSHAVDIFETTPDTTGQQELNKIDNKLKQLTKDMLNRFNPHLNVKLDTFIINKQIVLHDLTTGVDMRDSSLLILKETNFNVFNSAVNLNAEFDISNIEDAPFEAYFETEELNLEKVLVAFNYFGSETMKNAEILSGKLTMDINLKSSIKGIELIEDKTKAIIDIELVDLQLKGIDVIDRIAAKLFAKQLLEDVKFAPLTNTITITGSHIDIPQMEIQSTGIDLFVEGFVDNKKKTNVWLSVPLDNFTRRQTEKTPDKRGYAATKRKVYLEVLTDDQGEVNTKFRLRKKRFYQQRGITEQFKKDKKRYKKIRKKTQG